MKEFVSLSKSEFIILGGVFIGLFAAIVLLLSINLNYSFLVGAEYKSIIELRDECEEQLPRNKSCVMVFEFVPVEADYQ